MDKKSFNIACAYSSKTLQKICRLRGEKFRHAFFSYVIGDIGCYEVTLDTGVKGMLLGISLDYIHVFSERYPRLHLPELLVEALLEIPRKVPHREIVYRVIQLLTCQLHFEDMPNCLFRIDCQLVLDNLWPVIEQLGIDEFRTPGEYTGKYCLWEYLVHWDTVFREKYGLHIFPEPVG